MRTVADATSDIEVGLLTYCAGADPNYQPFLTQPVEVATGMVQRNCIVPVQMCHHFAGTDGRPGPKRHHRPEFGGCLRRRTEHGDFFTEALWAELHPQGVDVLSLVLGETDTPALRRRLRAERGFVDQADTPIPGVATVDQVVGDALAHLPDGPSWMVGEQLRAGLQMLGGMPRNDAVGLMTKAASATMDHGPEA